MSPTPPAPPLHVERVRGVELRFRTRPGVFSAKALDDGTRLLTERVDLAGADLVADLGCGAGPLGIAAAKLAPGAHVHLLDEHLRAVEVARDNVGEPTSKAGKPPLSGLVARV
jgi:16S rRNA (guanine1207-N2)-methyltransferase